MSPDIDWDLDTIRDGASDGTTLVAGDFDDFFAETIGGTPTWQTDEDGVTYIELDGTTSDSLNIATVSSGTADASTYLAAHVEGLQIFLADGQSWTADTVGTMLFDSNSGNDRHRVGVRGRIDSGVNSVDFQADLFSAVGITEWERSRVNREYLPGGDAVSVGWGRVNTEGGAFFINGHVAHAWNGDFSASTNATRIYRKIILAPKSYQVWRIYGGIKVWHSSNDFRTDSEFISGYDTLDYKAPIREPSSDPMGPYTISGTATTTLVDGYRSGGVNPRRVRRIISGSAGQTATFTMKDDHDFVTQSRRDTAAVQFLLYLPGGAEQIVSIDNGSGAVRRIEFDGATGTSSTRQIKVDVGLGTFGSSILTYDESKRYIVTVYIRSTGWSIVLHDVTTSGHSTQLWSSAQLGFGTAPGTSIKVSHTITMGSSGTPEFGEVVQCPPDWSGVDSWGSSGVQTIDGDSPGASMELPDDIQYSYGDHYVKFGQTQTGGVRNEHLFGSSGRSFKDLPTVFGDYDTLFPRMKGSRFRVYSTTPNPATDNHDPNVFVPVARTFIEACANAGVDLDWIFQPPVDDNPASDQDNLRATNDQIAAILQGVAGDITVRIVRLDNEYTDVEAAALSSDDVHPTAAGYKELGALVESLGWTTLTSGGNRPRTQRFIQYYKR